MTDRPAYTGSMKLALWTLSATLSGGLLGCGEVKDNNGLADAPVAPDDSGADAPGPAANAVRITALTLVGDGLPATTSTVVLVDASGIVVYDGPVDAQGVVEHEFAGGTAHVIQIADGGRTRVGFVQTVRGVKPGDDIVVGRKKLPTARTGEATSMTMTYDASSAIEPKFWTPCGAVAGTGTPRSLSLAADCHGPTFPVLATGASAASGQRLYATQTFSHVAGATVVFNAGFTAMPSFTVNVNNIPTEVDEISTTRSSMFDNLAVGTEKTTFAGDPVSAVTMFVPYVPLGSRSEIGVEIKRPDASSRQTTEIHTEGLATSATISLAGTQLPWFTSQRMTATGMTFQPVLDGAKPDGVAGLWYVTFVSGGKTTALVWQVYQEELTSPIDFPVLPAAYAAIDPRAQALTKLASRVIAFDYENVAGWDEFRQMPASWSEPSLSDVPALVGMPIRRRTMLTTASE